jgi:starch-binding outer membrane protein, SusD/RagB family
MKKINFSKLILLFAIMITVSIFSCTKLDSKSTDPYAFDPRAAGGTPTPSSLSEVYKQLNQLVGQGNWFAMQEHSTDELMGPTRGTDWDDFGTWRKLHLHTWDGAHNQINDTWSGINTALFQTTLIAETATGQTQAEAKFLRAYFSYICCDLFGQVQHRAATAAIADLPEVYTRSQAIDFVITELEAIIPNLPTYTIANRGLATKEAAQFLLAKCYLNKSVFKQSPESPAGPYTFDAGDMTKVISLTNSISTNAALSISTNYWNNFVWNNGSLSTENIFVRQKSGGTDMRFLTYMGGHYNMAPSGWNGFTTLSEFYNSFDAADVRRSAPIPAYTAATGRNAGFLIGQQQGPTGVDATGKITHNIGDPIVNLKDRSGNPLIFTPDVSLFFSTESKGIRTNKYPMDPSTINAGGDATTNDFVFFRFADVRLMKAEAILRGGTDPLAQTPLSIVNAIRTNRNVPALASINLTTLLSERGRELYLEGWRRNDLIRFGKFNAPVEERPNASAGTKCVYPIPTIALSSNPNLKQNAGY